MNAHLVIALHGFGGPIRTWPLEAHLRVSGRDVTFFAPTYDTRRSINDACVALWRPVVDAIVAHERAAPGGYVHVIGHSMGGVVAAALIRRIPRVESVTYLAAPLRGLAGPPRPRNWFEFLLSLVWLQPGPRDLIAGSPALRAIARDGFEPAGTRALSVYSMNDPWVAPRTSPILQKGQGTNWEWSGGPGDDHVGILSSPEVGAVLRAWLFAGVLSAVHGRIDANGAIGVAARK